jgi:ABC-type bacteriocin/lantibiotic exporter with double-glycine peptidase domain
VKALETQYRAQAFHIWSGLASQLLNAAVTIAILWVGANLVLARELTIGQLIAFNAFMGSVLAPLMGLVGCGICSTMPAWRWSGWATCWTWSRNRSRRTLPRG